jgi:parallel beta-helix repeat protein
MAKDAAAITLVQNCAQPLNQPGETYVLAGNLNCPAGGLKITADNVILNGNGFTLTGPGAPNIPKTIGVEVVGTKGVVIRNIRVTGFSEGIRIRSATRTRVLGASAIDNVVGMLLADAHQNSVVDSHFRAGYFGVYVSTSNHNLFERNWVTDNTKTSPNVVSGFSGGFIVLSSTGNRILRNNVVQNGKVGIWLYIGAHLNLVQYNRIDGTKGTGIASNGTNNQIRNNNVHQSINGIVLAKAATGHHVLTNTVLGSSLLDMTDENLPSVVNTWDNNNFTTDSEGNGPAQPTIE